MGLEFEYVPAVDGSLLRDEEIDRHKAMQTSPLGFGSGGIGCLLSHRMIWQKHVRSSRDWCFIAEDDAHLSPNCTGFLKGEDWAPSRAHIIKAETMPMMPEGLPMPPVKMGRRPRCTLNGHALRRLSSPHYGTAGYFISRTGAEQLLELTSTISDPVDHILFTDLAGILSSLDLLQFDPALCIQDFVVTMFRPDISPEFGSILTGDRFDRSEHHGRRKRNVRTGAEKLLHEFRRPIKQATQLARRMGSKALNIERPVGFPPGLGLECSLDKFLTQNTLGADWDVLRDLGPGRSVSGK